MIQAIFEYAFLQNAVIAAVLISIVSGIIGAIVMEKKMVMMSGGIAHTAFGGIGLGYFLGISPMIGALLFSVFASFGIATIQRKQQTNTDILIGLFGRSVWPLELCSSPLHLDIRQICRRIYSGIF